MQIFGVKNTFSMEIASVSMAFHFFFRKISVFRWENTTYLEKNRAFCEKKS